MKMAELHIGCSGFSYRHWRGSFYPEGLSQKEWFNHYGTAFSTVELNVTFYRTPRAETFQHWYEESAANFCFALKGSRYITHIKRLTELEAPLAKFFSPAQELREKRIWKRMPGGSGAIWKGIWTSSSTSITMQEALRQKTRWNWPPWC